ncbi:hypothetical protein [Virgibacillus sp. 6R]|uniref:hypothetical protein n=1 Tax=Metabacillus sp. 22489 TaxID=3453928 RepID=UPI00119CDE1C
MVWNKIDKIKKEQEREKWHREWNMLEKFLQTFFSLYPVETIKDRLIKSAENKYGLDEFRTEYRTSGAQLDKEKDEFIKITYEDDKPIINLSVECLFCLHNNKEYLSTTPTYKRIKKAMKRDFDIKTDGRTEYGDFTLSFYKVYRY